MFATQHDRPETEGGGGNKVANQNDNKGEAELRSFTSDSKLTNMMMTNQDSVETFDRLEAI